jgi:hypothetical protein
MPRQVRSTLESNSGASAVLACTWCSPVLPQRCCKAKELSAQRPSAHSYNRLRALNESDDIATKAWSPIAQGKVLGDPVVGRIAEAKGRTPAQVLLRWHIQRGDIVCPKSVTPQRIRENFELFTSNSPIPTSTL